MLLMSYITWYNQDVFTFVIVFSGAYAASEPVNVIRNVSLALLSLNCSCFNTHTHIHTHMYLNTTAMHVYC